MAEPIQLNQTGDIQPEKRTGAWVWIVIAVLIVLLALLLFGSSIFDNESEETTSPETQLNVNTTLQ